MFIISSMEGREPGNALILQAFFLHFCMRGKWCWWFVAEGSNLGLYHRAHAARKELAWQCTKQMCICRGSPAKPKWHMVGFSCSAALIATPSTLLQWNYLPELGFWSDTYMNRSWTLHCAPGNGHKDVHQGPRGTDPVTEKKSSVGCRISCFGDVNLDELQ